METATDRAEAMVEDIVSTILKGCTLNKVTECSPDLESKPIVFCCPVQNLSHP